MQLNHRALSEVPLHAYESMQVGPLLLRIMQRGLEGQA